MVITFLVVVSYIFEVAKRGVEKIVAGVRRKLQHPDDDDDEPTTQYKIKPITDIGVRQRLARANRRFQSRETDPVKICKTTLV